jgi:V/A-type H+-transporting ATPase subunit I
MTPVRMHRIAVVTPVDALRDALVQVAAAGVAELDHGDSAAADHGDLSVTAALSAHEPDLAALAQAGRGDLVAGETQLRTRRDAAVHRRAVAAVAGWCPEPDLAALRAGVTSVPAVVVPLDSPPGIDPPTLLGGSPRARRAFAPLVGLYGVVPYRDIDPSVAAGLAYVAMFGMMFGDAGHGLLLIAAAAGLRSGRIRRLASLRRLWVFVAGAGIAATVFGFLYGEFFGPTRVLPVLWLNPLDQPVRLLVTAVGVGAGLLALAYGFGVVNRWREGGLRLALYSSSGIAGAATFLGMGVMIAGYLAHQLPVLVAGAVPTGAGLALSVIGMFTESGGGATGVASSGVGLMDLVVHIGANLISFARLAAFGMTHAALGWVIWQGTTAAGGWGAAGIVAAALVFLIGNVLAFALEALVAGVQALRLEFYELFSRIFVDTGRSFTPWHIPIVESERVS